MITKVLEAQLGDGPVPTDAGVAKKAAKDDNLAGQIVEVKFPAKKAGKYNLQLICMSGLLCFPDTFGFCSQQFLIPYQHRLYASLDLQAETLQVV